MSIIIQTKFKIGDRVRRIHVSWEEGLIEALDIRYRRKKGEAATIATDYYVRWSRTSEDILRWYEEEELVSAAPLKGSIGWIEPATSCRRKKL